MLGIY